MCFIAMQQRDRRGPSPLSPRAKEQRWQCYGRWILRLLGRSGGGGAGAAVVGEAAGPPPAAALPGEAGGTSAAALLGEAVVASPRRIMVMQYCADIWVHLENVSNIIYFFSATKIHFFATIDFLPSFSQ